MEDFTLIVRLEKLTEKEAYDVAYKIARLIERDGNQTDGVFVRVMRLARVIHIPKAKG